MSPFTYSGIRFEMLSTRGTLPPDREVLWRMSGGRCFWCDRKMNIAGNPSGDVFFTVDHVYPRGQVPRGQSRHSKIAACRRCNNERGSMHAESYFQIWAVRLGTATPPCLGEGKA